MKDQLATGCCGINLFCETPESNRALVQVVEQFDEMLQRAPCPIQFPHTERLNQLALKIYEQQGLLEHPDATDLFSYRGFGAYAMGRFDWAFHQRALDIRQRVLGTDHPSVAATYNDLGLGKYERGVGTNHPETVETRKYYAALLRKMTPSKASNAAAPFSCAPSLEPGEQDHGRTRSE